MSTKYSRRISKESKMEMKTHSSGRVPSHHLLTTVHWRLCPIVIIVLVANCEYAFPTNPTPLPTPQYIWQAITPVAEPTLDTDEIPEGNPFTVHWGNNISAGGYTLFRRFQPTLTPTIIGFRSSPEGGGYYSIQDVSTLKAGQYYYRVHPFGGAFDRTDEGTPQPGWIGGVHIVTRTPTPAPTAFGTVPNCGPYSPYRVALNNADLKPVDCEIADVNGDGDPDLVFACGTNNEIVAFLSSSGSFSLSNRILINANYVIESSKISLLTSADLDDDGDIDIIATYPSESKVAWFENNGGNPPSFSTNTITTTENVHFIQAEYLDSDDYADILAFGSSGVFAYYNDGEVDPSFTKHTITTSSQTRSVTAADMDGDNNVDIVRGVFVPDVGGQIRLHINPGGTTPSFSTEGTTIVDSPSLLDIRHLEVGDIDNDGDNDLVLYREFGAYPGIFWIENCDCPEGFQEHLLMENDYYLNPEQIRLADWDGDGFLDIIAYTSEDVLIRLMNSGSKDPYFTEEVVYGGIDGFKSLEVADVDLDGDTLPDVIYCAKPPSSNSSEIGFIANTDYGDCPDPPSTPTPTPSYYPTPKQIWELPPNPTYVQFESDFVASSGDYSVHFGGNLPNLPNHYKVYKKSDPEAAFQSISPTLVYNDESNSFGFNQTASGSDAHPLFKVEVTDWQTTPIPGGSVEQDHEDPRRWMQGLVYNTPVPLPSAPTPAPPNREIWISVKSTEEFESGDLPDLDYWPVTTAIPFPPGEVFDWQLEGFRVKDSEGEPVPAQFRIKEHWPDSSNSVRWLQLDFQVTMGTIADEIEEQEYQFIYDPTVDNPDPADPLRIYESLKPLFQLDFEHTANPVIATIADPGRETPLNEFDIPNGIGCGYGYDPQGLGGALDARDGDLHLCYDSHGNIDMRHGTLELWYKPDWSINPVPETKQPTLISLYEPPIDSLNYIKLFLDLTQSSTAYLKFHLADQDPVPALTLTTEVELIYGTNWKDQDWNHIAISWDTDHGIRLFLNGKLVDDDRRPFGINIFPPWVMVPDEITIGFMDWGSESDSYYYADGMIDDVRIFEDFTEELTFTQQSLRLSFDDFVDGVPEVPVSGGFLREPIVIQAVNPSLTPTPVSKEELGVQNSALVFDGNEYLRIPNNGIAYPRFLGVDFWFRIDTVSTEQALFHIHTTNNPFFTTEDIQSDGITGKYVPGDPATIKVTIDDGEGGTPNPITLSVEIAEGLKDHWHHIAFLAKDPSIPLRCDYDEVLIPAEEGDWENDGGFKLVIDGGYSEAYEAWNYPLNLFPSKEIWIGAIDNGTSILDSEGAIDEFRIWNYPRMPREKVSAFCADVHYQIRLDKGNSFDLVQRVGKIIVDGRDIIKASSTPIPGFIVEDKKVTTTDQDEFYSANASYYSQEGQYSIKPAVAPLATVTPIPHTVYHRENKARRVKVNDFRIEGGDLRTSITVRSLCNNGEADVSKDESGFSISRYYLYPGIPFVKKDHTLVFTKMSNPDPYHRYNGGSWDYSDARKYRDLALAIKTDSSIDTVSFGYDGSGSDISQSVNPSSTRNFVFQTLVDMHAESESAGWSQPALTPIPRQTLTNPGSDPNYHRDWAGHVPTPLRTRSHDPDHPKRYEHRILTGDNSVSQTLGKMEGWVAYSGADRSLVSFMADLPEMYPKVFSVEDGLSKVHLWGYKALDSTVADDPGISKVHVDLESIRNFYFVHQGTYDEDSDDTPGEEAYLLDFNVPAEITKYGGDDEDSVDYERHDHHLHAETADAIGLSRSHEMWFLPMAEQASSSNFGEMRKINDLLQSRVFAVPDPVAMARGFEDDQLRAYRGNVTGETNNVLKWVQEIDKALNDHYQAWIDLELWQQPYGMFNWLDHGSEWGNQSHMYNGKWRLWAGNHHRVPAMHWIQFFRTGNPSYLRTAIRNSRKVADTYYVHWEGGGFSLKDKPKGGHHRYNGLVPWGTDSTAYYELQFRRPQNEMHYNSLTDYLGYLSYFTESDWGTETALDFVRARKTWDIRNTATENIERFGAGGLDGMISVYTAAEEAMNSVEKLEFIGNTDTTGYLKGRIITAESKSDWEEEIDFPVSGSFGEGYGMIKAQSYGGRYNSLADDYKTWSLWLSRLYPFYQMYFDNDPDPYRLDVIQNFLKKWTHWNTLRRGSYGIHRYQRTDLGWSALILAKADELNLTSQEVRDLVREDWHFIDRVFKWSVYHNEDSVYNNHAFPYYGPLQHGSYDSYLVQPANLFISAIIRDQERSSPIIPPTGGEWGPGSDESQFDIGVKVDTSSDVNICGLSGPLARPAGMTVKFDEESIIRPFGGFDNGNLNSHYPHVFFNFDDCTIAPSGGLGATCFSGGTGIKFDYKADYGKPFGMNTLTTIEDPEDGIFGQCLDIGSGQDEGMMIEPGPLFSPDSDGNIKWTISFWVRRGWDDSPSPDRFRILSTIPFVPPHPGTPASNSLVLELKETDTDEYQFKIGTVDSSGMCSGDFVENATLSNVTWDEDHWKKIIISFSHYGQSPQYRLNLFILDRHGCSTPDFTSGTSMDGLDDTAPIGTIHLGGCDEETADSWPCQIDNFMVHTFNTTGLNVETSTGLTFFVYKSSSGGSSDYLIDADYDVHMSYISPPATGNRAYNSLQVYPGKRNSSQPVYYLMCPMSDDPDEKVEANNSRNIVSAESRIFVRERAPIVFKSVDYGSNEIVLNSGLTGEFEQYSVLYPDETPIPTVGSEAEIDWSGDSRVILQSPGIGRPNLSVKYATPNPTPTRMIFEVERQTH